MQIKIYSSIAGNFILRLICCCPSRIRHEFRDIEKGKDKVEETTISSQAKAKEAMILYTHALEKIFGNADWVVSTIKVWEAGW